jgi:hypothetical protein
MRRVATVIGDERFRGSAQASDDWITHGLDCAETRFSRLDQINSANVSELGLAWSLDLGTRRGIEATPIVVGGCIFLTAPSSVVYALDARTAEESGSGIHKSIKLRMLTARAATWLIAESLYTGPIYPHPRERQGHHTAPSCLAARGRRTVHATDTCEEVVRVALRPLRFPLKSQARAPVRASFRLKKAHRRRRDRRAVPSNGLDGKRRLRSRSIIVSAFAAGQTD